MAVADEEAWGEPVIHHEPEPAGRRLGIPLAVAVLVCIVSGIFVYKYLVRPMLMAPRSAAKSTPAQPTQPAAPAPAPSPTPEPPPASETKPETKPETKAEAPPVTTAPPAPSGTGNFTIQVRSSPNEADAREAANALNAAGYEAYVQRADLGARGTWYRVRVGRFQTRDDARQTLSKLRASGRASDALVQAYEVP